MIKILVKIKSYQKSSLGSRNEFEKNKKNYDKLSDEIKNFEILYKNVWAPTPKYTKKIDFINYEKISFNNCIFNIQFKIKKIDKMNEKLDLIIIFIN